MENKMKLTATITLNFKKKPRKKDILFHLFDMLKINKIDYVLIRNNNKENKNEQKRKIRTVNGSTSRR